MATEALPAALSGEERGALKELLAYVEDRVRDHDPVCAKLVQMARLALDEFAGRRDSSPLLH